MRLSNGDSRICGTAKKTLERRGIQTSSSFDKIWLVCFPEFKANFLFFWHSYGLGFFLSRIYWSSLDYDLMASIWEKVISILREIWIQLVIILSIYSCALWYIYIILANEKVFLQQKWFRGAQNICSSQEIHIVFFLTFKIVFLEDTV